jgi:hypothetical protein
MTTSIAILLAVTCLTLFIALAYAVITRAELSDTKTELQCTIDNVFTRNIEIERLRTQQARKLDRALWMLVSARTEKMKEPLTFEGMMKQPEGSLRISLHSNVIDALNAPSGTAVDRHELSILIADHIVRRVNKTATTA